MFSQASYKSNKQNKLVCGLLSKDDDDWVKKGVTLEVDPRKTWKDVVHKDMNDLHINPSDAMDHSKWRRMIGRNWNDRSIDSDAESWIRIVRYLVPARPG